jgi:hypothetical protein
MASRSHSERHQKSSNGIKCKQKSSDGIKDHHRSSQVIEGHLEVKQKATKIKLHSDGIKS